MFSRSELLKARSWYEERYKLALEAGECWNRALEGVDAVLSLQQDVPPNEPAAKKPDGLYGQVVAAVQKLAAETAFTNREVLEAMADATIEVKSVVPILRRLAEEGVIDLKEAGAGRRPASYVKRAAVHSEAKPNP